MRRGLSSFVLFLFYILKIEAKNTRERKTREDNQEGGEKGFEVDTGGVTKGPPPLLTNVDIEGFKGGKRGGMKLESTAQQHKGGWGWVPFTILPYSIQTPHQQDQHAKLANSGGRE